MINGHGSLLNTVYKNMSCPLRRILTFKEALNFPEIRIINLQGTDMTNVYMYSWSADGTCWSSWVTYEQYRVLAKNVESDMYIRVLVTDSIGQVFINTTPTNCYNVCIESDNFTTFACDDPNLFQPYQNLDCALLLQQQLADTVICMFGIPIYYFRVDPDVETKDWTFKEFSLHHVVGVKQLKLMIEDGQMPSSNPKLTELDFDWQPDWETELSKTQFARAFGDKAIPKARDFIYVPMMKRMWEVSAAYDEKAEGLLWRSTTWKLQLIKYTKDVAVDNGSFEDIVDNMLKKTYQNTIEEMEHTEQIRSTGWEQVQAPQFAATNLTNIFMQDAIRYSYTQDDIQIIDKILCHKPSIVSRNMYQFRNPKGLMVYQHKICGDSGCISMIFETSLGHTIIENTKILQFGPIELELGYTPNDRQYYIGVGDLVANVQPFSTYMLIFSWSHETSTCELKIYKHISRHDMPKYVLPPTEYFFDLERPVADLVGPYNPDYIIETPQTCQISAWPLAVTNIKLYNRYLGSEGSIKEALKYTTTDDRCVFADLARPLNAGRGYAVS